MARIERFVSRTDAELAKSVLEDAGIPAYVSHDDAGGVHPEIPFGIGGTAVVVPDDRYEEACTLLDAAGGALSDQELTEAALAAGEPPSDAGTARMPDTMMPPLAGEAPAVGRSAPSGRMVLVVVVLVVLVIAVVSALTDVF